MMKQKWHVYLVLLLLTGVGVSKRPLSATPATDAVVGTGTPASCTEAAFNTALANVQASGDGEVSFNCGGPATIVFTSQKVIDSNLVIINGGGVVTLSGQNSTRLFHVLPGAFELRNITLTNGFSGNGYGGAILAEQGSSVYVINSTIQNSRTASGFAGGAILSYATNTTIPTVSIENSIIQGNESDYAAINTIGKLVVSDSLIQNNIGSTGGGITVGGLTIITNTEFRNNEASYGGAIYITGSAVVEMTGGRITDNNAPGRGGGISNEGQLTLTDVTIVNNTARSGSPSQPGYGGGIVNFGSALLDKVTMEGNFAIAGGAFYNSNGNDMVVRNSTFVNNDAGLAGLAYNQGLLAFQNATLWHNAVLTNSVSIFNGTGGYLTFRNTIMGGDEGSHCNYTPFTPGDPAASSNFSLFEDSSCNWQSGNGNIVQSGLAMGPLGSHGGLTWTMLPPANSPAIDAGQCNLAEDQRGVSRPQGAACDIGSVERRPGDGGYFVYLPLVVR